jgi:U4/U6.U5 tri-snRNP-associated protein 3
MVEPPHKRPRRSDQDIDRWRDSPNRNGGDTRERVVKEDRGGRDRYDRESHKERDRRYRSRSPERERDRNRDRERDRDRRDGHGRERGGRRDELRDRDRERDRDHERGARRDEARERDYRDSRRGVGGRGGRGGRDRDQDQWERKRTRQDDDRRASRSRSPARDVRAHLSAERSPGPSKFLDIDVPRGPKSRTATPPVAFKVGTGGQLPGAGHSNGHVHKESPDHSRGQTPAAYDSEAMDTDVPAYEDAVPTKSKAKAEKQTKIEEKNVEEDDDIIVEEDDSMAAMQAMLGFGGFGTTKQKKVVGNDVYAVRKEKKTEYRQYMNRVGGFNRPLSPSRD